VTPVVWLALAMTQWKLGRLVPSVKENALEVIDSGADLQRWSTASEKERRKRAKVLSDARATLLSDPPAPKRVRPRFRQATDWEIGDLLAHDLADGRRVFAVVIGHHVDMGGRCPILVFLQWSSSAPPARDEVGEVPVRELQFRGVARPATKFMAAQWSKRDAPLMHVVERGVEPPVRRKPHEGFALFWWRDFTTDVLPILTARRSRGHLHEL
jgi:hypothetical protein